MGLHCIKARIAAEISGLHAARMRVTMKRDKINDTAIGERMRILRKQILGSPSQSELGEMLHLSREEVSRIERGLVSIQPEYANKLLELSGGSRDWLYYGIGPMLEADMEGALDKYGDELSTKFHEDKKKRAADFAGILKRAGYSVQKVRNGGAVSIRPCGGTELTPDEKIPLVLSISDFQDLADRFAFQSEAMQRSLAEAILLGKQLDAGGEPARFKARAGKLLGRGLTLRPLLNLDNTKS